ncbi:MAG: GWxTD domain-containing protein [candidate division KSB1 bacterium]|nr:GWxTD domain-containing protein [candidate division KSB1 bacterium]MDZ7317538.1 GWxTD domain-containing protein [candidate division KSB1 bacterium]MDZ7340931.1 GWxTD domain-containing protein [candidate division KSB1 bacterium]
MSQYKLFSVLCLTLCLVLILAGVVLSQISQQAATGPEQLYFGFDLARFRAQQDFVFVELYYSTFRNYLKFVADSAGWTARFSFKAEIFQNDSLLATEEWINFDHVDSLSDVKQNQKLFGLGYFALKPGDHILKLSMTDLNSNLTSEKKRNLFILPFPVTTLAISDIELATQISPSNQQTRFYKNGYQLIPNPDQIYGTGLPMLTFYAEIYNLTKSSDADTGSYSVQYRLLSSEGLLLREFPPRVRKKPGASAVEVSAVNIISFRSGTYFLEIVAQDFQTGQIASQQKKFFIYREGDLALSDSATQKLNEEKLRALMERTYKNMSSQALDEEFESASYIATNEEKNIYKKLDLPGKQAFLLEFWRKRDKTPETPQNEYRDEYLKLVNTANHEFSGFKRGWKSDRGRVLLVYGPPDEIERVPLSMETKAHHIWKYYSIQGGVIFVFVDKQGFGDFELVHSTARGELSDDDWERWIDPNR